jgi:hypothetical protein
LALAQKAFKIPLFSGIFLWQRLQRFSTKKILNCSTSSFFAVMNLSSLVASGFLLASSFAGHAQATEPAPIPRFYGGLGLYTSSHQNLSSWGIDGARIPVQAVVGYQWRPRLAVQLGVAYSGNRSQYAYNYFYSPNYPAPAGAKTDVAGTYTERSITTSLLARYTLTRKLAHRFQADLIGGVKVEYSRYHDVGISTSYDQTATVIGVTPYEYPSTYNSTLLSLGISLRYRVVSQLEAMYDFTFDQPVSNGGSRYGLRPSASMALGVRYRFGPS